MFQRRYYCARFAPVLVLTLASTGCAGQIKRVNVSYATQPSKQWPATVKVIEVDKPNYPYRATEDGIMRDAQLQWYQHLVQQLQMRFEDADVVVRQREDMPNTEVVNRERDALGDPDRKPDLVPADAVIIPRFVVTSSLDQFIEGPSTREKLVAAGSRLIPGVGGMVPAPQSKERWRLVVKVSCALTMTVAGSQQILASYARELESVEITDPGKWFGLDSRRKAYELSSAERLAEKLVTEHADEFAGQYLVIERQVRVDLTDVGRESSDAIDLLNAKRVEQARAAALAAYEHKKKDHVACYVVGLTHEIRQNWSEAVQWYSLAMGIRPLEPEYEKALQRAESAERGTRVAGRAIKGRHAAEGALKKTAREGDAEVIADGHPR